MRSRAVLILWFLCLFHAVHGHGAPAGPAAPALNAAERSWVAAHPRIRIQMARASQPFEFRGPQGEPQGLAYDTLRLACAKVGLAVEVTDLTWPVALEAIQRPHPPVDLLLGVTDSDERRRQMLLTRTYVSFPYVIFTTKQHPFLGSLADLFHSTVAVEKDDVMESWLRRDLPEARILALSENRRALEAVSEGQADAYVGNLAIGSFTIENLGLVNLKVAAPAPYGQDAYSFGVRRDWPGLVAVLDKGIQLISPQEEVALRLRWLQVRYDYGLRWRQVLAWLALAAALAAAFILQLKRMVRLRTAELAAEVARRSALEGELRGSLARESDTQRRLADILEFLPDATLVLDRGHRVLAWNRAMEVLCGRSKVAMLGQPSSAVAPLFYGQARALLADLVLHEGPLETGLYPGLTRQGSMLSTSQFLPGMRQGRGAWLYATASPLMDRDGRVAGAIESIRDITEQRSLEARLAQSQRLEAIGTLAAGISHDFNNILAAVGGYAELALRRDVDAGLKQDLQGIAKASARATDLVRQILAFSRVLPEPPRPLDPGPLVGEALKLLRATVPAGVRMENDLGGTRLVLADPAEIHRIVVNLCSNASVAMGGTGLLKVDLGDVEPSEALRAALPGLAPGPQVRLRVEDNGCGMAPELLERIFDPFFTTRAGAGGSGMGLAVVHGIVKARGGAIQVESAPGRGTAFSVYLPAVDPVALPEAAPDGAPQPVTGRRGRLLLVDDEPMLLDVCARNLQLRGWEVQAEEDPRAALERLRQDPRGVDLLVTDRSMPGLGGLELAAAAKALRPDLPVALITGYEDPDLDPRASGVDLVLIKPVRSDDLDEALRHLLG